MEYDFFVGFSGLNSAHGPHLELNYLEQCPKKSPYNK
jgi:hypothetical protein